MLLFGAGVVVMGLLGLDLDTVGAGSLWAQALLLVGAAAGASALMIALPGGAREDLGWPPPHRIPLSFVVGLGGGLMIAAVAVPVGVLLSGAELRLDDGSLLQHLGAVPGVLGVLLVAALGEELLFRGYPLRVLGSGLGPLPASIVLTLLFSLLHAGNPDVSFLGLVNIGLASLLLCAVFFTRGAIAAAWGVHFGWNAGLMEFDAPVSGVQFDVPFVEYVPGGPEWVSGGAFGPEGGVVASVAMLAALAIVIRKLVRVEVAS